MASALMHPHPSSAANLPQQQHGRPGPSVTGSGCTIGADPSSPGRAQNPLLKTSLQNGFLRRGKPPAVDDQNGPKPFPEAGFHESIELEACLSRRKPMQIQMGLNGIFSPVQQAGHMGIEIRRSSLDIFGRQGDIESFAGENQAPKIPIPVLVRFLPAPRRTGRPFGHHPIFRSVQPNNPFHRSQKQFPIASGARRAVDIRTMTFTRGFGIASHLQLSLQLRKRPMKPFVMSLVRSHGPTASPGYRHERCATTSRRFAFSESRP